MGDDQSTVIRGVPQWSESVRLCWGGRQTRGSMSPTALPAKMLSHVRVVRCARA